MYGLSVMMKRRRVHRNHSMADCESAHMAVVPVWDTRALQACQSVEHGSLRPRAAGRGSEQSADVGSISALEGVGENASDLLGLGDRGPRRRGPR